jgi:hypothetical protein
VIVFRHADPRLPFLGEDEPQPQPAGRWHAPRDGPLQHFADTPNGAWAEFLRHEEIREPEELANVRRAIWAVEIGELPAAVPALPRPILTGGLETHPVCRAEALRLRRTAARGFVAPAAALTPGAARGWRVQGGLRPAGPRDGRTVVLFGPRPDLVGWIVAVGRPPADVLDGVRHLAET